MKKLLLTLAIIFSMTVFAQSQQINFPEGSLLVYSDTNNLAGGDVLIRSIYAFVPQKISDTTYEYQYKRIEFYVGRPIHINEFISYEAKSDETLLISGTPQTYDWMYPQVVTINEATWKIASWQTFLQKIN
jgi:hypothetical protein